MQVKIAEYGFSKDFGGYYITYQVSDLKEDERSKLEERLEDPVTIKDDDLVITMIFQEEYFPFKSEESQINPADYIAREELEMTAYLLGLLED